jgi:hypothetical protein
VEGVSFSFSISPFFLFLFLITFEILEQPGLGCSKRTKTFPSVYALYIGGELGPFYCLPPTTTTTKTVKVILLLINLIPQLRTSRLQLLHGGSVEFAFAFAFTHAVFLNVRCARSMINIDYIHINFIR